MVTLGDLQFWDASFWYGHERELVTLALYGVGFALYALVVAFFYRFISLRDLRSREASEKETSFGRRLLDGLRYLFAFPLLSFSYFAVLAAALFLLAKNLTVEQILLTSMSLVVGVRVAAYVSEGTATDLAKLVPLGLLGVLVIDPGYLSLQATTDRFLALPGLLPTLLRYFLAMVALELGLRIVRKILPSRRPKREPAATLVPESRAELAARPRGKP